MDRTQRVPAPGAALAAGRGRPAGGGPVRAGRSRGREAGTVAGDDGDGRVVAGAVRTMRSAAGARLPEALAARLSACGVGGRHGAGHCDGRGDAVRGPARAARDRGLRRPAQPAGLARLAVACAEGLTGDGGRSAAEHDRHARTRPGSRTPRGRRRSSAVGRNRVGRGSGKTAPGRLRSREPENGRGRDAVLSCPLGVDMAIGNPAGRFGVTGPHGHVGAGIGHSRIFVRRCRG